MQNSRIVLHNINFETGMHERIFTAMLAGAVCVTSKYQLLKKFFEDGKEIGHVSGRCAGAAAGCD